MSNEKEVYCQLVGTEKGIFSKKVTVTLNVGQKSSWFDDKTLKDEDGKVIKFNSMIDALNHMAKDGWLFVSANTITIDKQNVYHYLMRKLIA